MKNETKKHVNNKIIQKKKKVQATLTEIFELGVINQAFKYYNSRFEDLHIGNLQTCN